MNYQEFLKTKVVVAPTTGFDPAPAHPVLFPHQQDITQWACKGGRRAIFASFGLGKSVMQLEIGRQCITQTGKPFLITCPLGVRGEFRRDAGLLNLTTKYITSTDQVDGSVDIYLTNYERIRNGSINPESFGGVSFDEASIIRNLKTQTTQAVLEVFRKIEYRFVATATPTPNNYIEILNYADYLGVIDRGHALTRFFKRDSTKAGNLTLLDTQKEDFWRWVSTWAVFVNTPADLGHDDTGYVLPDLKLVPHMVSYEATEPVTDRDGNVKLFRDTTKSLVDVSREKRDSMQVRMSKVADIIGESEDRWIVWHHREKERDLLEKLFKGQSVASVYGSLDNDTKEDRLIGFSEGQFDLLLSKPKIAGSGCNFQHACHRMIFAGIDYKFNDFIQAIHRCYRFGQTKQVEVHVIMTDAEQPIWEALQRKWSQHRELQKEMTDLVREYGLNNDALRAQMERKMFADDKTIQIGPATLHNGDTVPFTASLDADSVDMVLTSIPFGDHYEYSDNYNDFGHNHGNEGFFSQMDFLTGELLRVTRPGRIAAIHVKDRIRYSHQNGTCFTTIDDFSGDTVRCFKKAGWFLIGKITITTDVVSENNQTYRLTMGEKLKDGTKMGVGLPEYVLLFRKAPTDPKNAYADVPVTHTIDDYRLGRWQLDAHAYWRSSGNRHLPISELRELSPKRVYRAWRDELRNGPYDFKRHCDLSDAMEADGKLSKKFMSLEPHSNHEQVWTDIRRTNTLNAKQVNRKKEKHICPLQLDIIERLIERYTNKRETVFDPFGGLFSTAVKAMQMNRRAVSAELNSEYFSDGVQYVQATNYEMSVPTLFDLMTP